MCIDGNIGREMYEKSSSNAHEYERKFPNSSYTFVQPLQINIKRLALLVKFSVTDILKYFSYFSKKTGFDISCKLSLMSNPVFWKNKKTITNLSSAELTQSVVKIK